MPGDATPELQTAIFTVLNADAGISALGASVYDFIEELETTPFVQIGDTTLTPWFAMTQNGQIATATIHSYSRNEGKLEIKQIMQAIYNALHKQDLTIAGYSHIETLWEFSNVITEQIDLYHGVQRFRIWIHE